MAETTRGSEQAWWAVLLGGIAAILLGAFVLTSPGRTLVALVTAIALYWLVRGLIELAEVVTAPHVKRGSRWVASIAAILGGLFVLAYPFVMNIVPAIGPLLALGIVALISGIALIVHGATGGGGASIIIGIFDLLVAAMLLGSPYIPLLAVPFVLGAIALIGGLVLLGVAFALRGHQHSATHRMAPA